MFFCWSALLLQNRFPLTVIEAQTIKMCLDTVLFPSKCFHFLLTLLSIRRERRIFSTYCWKIIFITRLLMWERFLVIYFHVFQFKWRICTCLSLTPFFESSVQEGGKKLLNRHTWERSVKETAIWKLRRC